MDEQEPVRINLQLPASALDSLSRLAEQLRRRNRRPFGVSPAAGAGIRRKYIL